MPTFHSQSSGTLLEEQSSRKRSYHDFLRSESRTQSPSLSPPHLRFSITPIPSDLPDMPRASPLPPRRFVGDGFDYRRPVMSTISRRQVARTPTPAPTVIDLTNDSDTPPTRPVTRRSSVERRIPQSQHSTRRHHDPRGQSRHDARSAIQTQASGGSVIVDMTDIGTGTDLDGPLMVNDDDILALFPEPLSSPGFEITGERSVRPDPPRRSVAERRPTPYVTEEDQIASEPPQLPAPLFRNLPHGLASWIARAAGSRTTGGEMAGRTERNIPHESLRLNRYTLSDGYRTASAESNRVPNWHPQPQLQLPRIAALDGFQRPRLNYEAQGFELIGAARSSPPPRPSSPYKAPRAAAEGFSRKVEEHDMVVCPHCGDELGRGNDDLKQQIWVVKQCGHVYCGECAINRHVGKGKRMALQAEGKPEPFKTCVVPDCKKQVTSKTALFQVYL